MKGEPFRFLERTVCGVAAKPGHLHPQAYTEPEAMGPEECWIRELECTGLALGLV